MRLQEYGKLILNEALPTAIAKLKNDIDAIIKSGNAYEMPAKTGDILSNPLLVALQKLDADYKTLTSATKDKFSFTAGASYTKAKNACDAIKSDMESTKFRDTNLKLETNAPGSPTYKAAFQWFLTSPATSGLINRVRSTLKTDVVGAFISSLPTAAKASMPDYLTDSLIKLLNFINKEDSKGAKAWTALKAREDLKKLFIAFDSALKKLETEKVSDTSVSNPYTLDKVKKINDTYKASNFQQDLLDLYNDLFVTDNRLMHIEATLDNATRGGANVSAAYGQVEAALTNIKTKLVPAPTDPITIADDAAIDAWNNLLIKVSEANIPQLNKVFNTIEENYKDYINDKAKATQYSNSKRDWAAEFKKLESEGDVDGIRKLWEKYYEEEWTDDAVRTAVKNLGQAFTNELLRIGFSEKENPFITFVKDHVIDFGLNTRNYAAVHNAYLDRYIISKTLRHKNENNILQNKNLYRNAAPDIYELLKTQYQVADDNNYEKLIERFKIPAMKDPATYGDGTRADVFLAALMLKDYSPLDLDTPSPDELRTKELKSLTEVRTLLKECVLGGEEKTAYKASEAPIISSKFGSKEDVAKAIAYLIGVYGASNIELTSHMNDWAETKAIKSLGVSEMTKISRILGEYDIDAANVAQVIKDLAASANLTVA